MKNPLQSRAIIVAALVAAFATPCSPVIGQTAGKTSVVIASVADAQSGGPLADAQVSLSDLNVSARTDWSGEARIPNIASGQHKFEIRRPGYEPLDVDLLVQGDSTGPVFRLVKATVPAGNTLEPVKVPVEAGPSYLAGFEQRRQLGQGRFLTAADLEKKGNRSLVVVLAQSFGSLMSTPDPERAGRNILLTRRTRPSLANGQVQCGVDVWYNNSRFADDLDSLRPTDLAGVEYYAVESAPGAFRRPTSNCGVLVLWSKQ